jgi:hypothetical protein
MSNIKKHNKNWKQGLQWFFVLTLKSKFLRTLFTQLGALSEFENWKRKFTPAPRYRNRELLWKSILPKFDSTEMLVLEFGVAHGYATNWWLRHNKARNIEWHGFDTFTGLPTSWTRGGVDTLNVGSFSAGGNVPPFDDSRITWHIGNVFETIKDLNSLNTDGYKTLYLFDMDLGEPTRFCIESLKSKIKEGDIFYFDEAFDPWNERKVISEVLFSIADVETLGSTATALAFLVRKRL